MRRFNRLQSPPPGSILAPFIHPPPPVMAPVQAKEAATPSTTKPVATFRLRGISASVFANHAKSEGRDITFHKVSIERAYKDGDDWKHTTSFGRNDLPILQAVLQRAYEYMLESKPATEQDDDAE